MERLKKAGLVFLGFGLGLSLINAMTGTTILANFLKNAIVNGASAVLLWSGIEFLTDWLDGLFPWNKNTKKRLFFSIITTIGYVFLTWILVVYIWQILFKGSFSLSLLMKLLSFSSFLFTLIISLFVSSFMHGEGFLKAWKSAIMETERLKKEQISARYETLKNQVNPHFLFNSFNVLTTLVHKDADMAEQFVRQLSTVYRYVLESRDKEVVPLAEELKQLEAYIYLMKIRFGDSLKPDISVENTEGVVVAPLTLQMLIENALKHNETSKQHPFSIAVFREGDYLVVKNTIQLKNSVGESTGLGLENIQSRYAFLSDKPVIIEKDKGDFVVKIPVILN